jgi:rfaE bifunctional protein kinase chain/domain
MQPERLKQILAGLSAKRILVVGDYFLDKYLDIDHSLGEVSLETGLEAHQVVRVRCSPGAAGTVASNLRALGVGVVALGVIGHDGEGFELLRGLRQRGVETEHLLRVAERFTPTYTKPMLYEADGSAHELSRLDLKNRQPLGPEMEEEIIARLKTLVPTVDAVIVADQVPERNCGVISEGVRQALIELASRYPTIPIAADSRRRIGEYHRITLKPNERELLSALRREAKGRLTLPQIEAAAHALCQRNQCTAFVTIGERGILVCSGDACQHIPAVPVTGPIDIVGAGDSTMAGIVSALSCGALLAEAALVGNLVASVTIRCIGATGTASQAEVQEALALWTAAHNG